MRSVTFVALGAASSSVSRPAGTRPRSSAASPTARRPTGGDVPSDHRAVADAANAGREPRPPEVIYETDPIAHSAGSARAGVGELVIVRGEGGARPHNR